MATHPETSGKIFVTFYDKFGGPESGMYVSDDAGETWTFLTSQSGGQLLFTPTFPHIFYSTGGEAQLRRSFDDGQTWEDVTDAPRPLSLATGTDGERVVLYIGSPGGVIQTESQAETQTSLFSNTIFGGGVYRLLGGGVYRLTSLLPTEFVYLPSIMR